MSSTPRRCTICGKDETEVEFYRHRQIRPCKRCHCKRDYRYYLKRRERDRAFAESDRVQRLARNKEYAKKHRTQLSVKHRLWRHRTGRTGFQATKRTLKLFYAINSIH